MPKPSVRRKDISLHEEVQSLFNGIDGMATVPTGWTANLDGRLSTGEYVEMYRRGKTSDEAVKALEAAIKEEGWRVDD